MAMALIIDDEVDLCRLMQMTLKRMQIDAIVAYDIATAVRHLAEHTFDFCLTDLRLPDGSGLDIVKLINAQYPSTPVAVITAHGNMDLAIEALKLGAFDFVNKPLELPRLRQLVENGIKAAQDAKEQTVETAPDLFAGKLIGESESIRQLKQTIQKLARSQAPVFLWGGSGTGKEVVAKLIHELSPRAPANFVPVNCGAIPSELMESEFFGHKKGSFTGATIDKEGLFQQANGGTLFLDEVADLPLAMQVKLLRAIQEKKVRPIGSTQEIDVDIRLLSATHKNLAQLVENGDFRQDLYYRINVIEVKLPSLNERKEDVSILANHFLQMIVKDWGLEQAIELTEAAKQALLAHQYSGNVRELRNILERAITLSDGHLIDAEHLHLSAFNPNPQPSNTHATQTASVLTTPSSVLVASAAAMSKPESPAPSPAKVENNPAPAPFASAISPDANPPAITAILKDSRNNFYNQGTFEGITGLRQSVNILPSTVAAVVEPVMPTQTPVLQTPIIQTIAPMNLTASTLNPLPTAPILQGRHQVTTCTELPPEGLEEYLANQEKQLIIAALNQCNWNKTQAAKLLNTSFRSLRYRMKKLEIGDDD